MTSFVSYQIKVALCLMVFMSLYYLLFRKETFLRLNRFLLLGLLGFSFLLPALHLPVSTINVVAVPKLIGAVTVYAGQLEHEGPVRIGFTGVVSVVYLSGILLFSLYFLQQLALLLWHIYKGETVRQGGYTLVVLPEYKQSFSFLHLVFMNRPPDPDDPVLLHELAHIRQLHSMDLILIQLIKIFQWFNPFLFLAEKAMQETHEYLADASVLEQDGEADRYRLLLLSRVFGVQPGMFSFFNHSQIKNRMIMLTKQKSPISHRFKYLSVLPVFVLLFLAISCQKKAPVAADNSMTSDSGKVMEMPAMAEDTNFYVFVEKQAEFQGGDIQTFREWVQKNLVYPPAAVKAGIFGKVIVQFAVDENGKVGNIKIERGVAPSLDEATIKALQSSPDWIPAEVGGKKVKQKFIIPVIYMLQ